MIYPSRHCGIVWKHTSRVSKRFTLQHFFYYKLSINNDETSLKHGSKDGRETITPTPHEDGLYPVPPKSTRGSQMVQQVYHQSVTVAGGTCEGS